MGEDRRRGRHKKHKTEKTPQEIYRIFQSIEFSKIVERKIEGITHADQYACN